MPDLNWNTALWGSDYDWAAGGEEWSQAWGGSEAQWFGSLLPRLHRMIPAERILEIAPGYGRWSRFLVPACASYLGIDLSQACVDACEERFSRQSHARFVKNDGLSLDDAEDGMFDFVFSFDSLVHAEMDVLSAYVSQIVRKLSKDGVAFLHHSNLEAFSPPAGSHAHFRGKSVSGQRVADLVARSGGQVLVQEIITWPAPDSGPIDCLTTFARAGGANEEAPAHLLNLSFTQEAKLVASFQQPYCRIRGKPSAGSTR